MLISCIDLDQVHRVEKKKYKPAPPDKIEIKKKEKRI